MMTERELSRRARHRLAVLRHVEEVSGSVAAGSDAGIADLENTLGLVRDKPFAGQENPWADSVQQEMLSRITDVAHTLAT
ncbi:hypothetical protein [Streptomyces sp. MS1.AVA.4]|uniref:Uncharacterized protein n=1 Tax=Streptomyces pratisoli TaxID=3139917 RepID=A0ACC6Q9Q4_9ACTN